jgi:hypothetical protein
VLIKGKGTKFTKEIMPGDTIKVLGSKVSLLVSLINIFIKDSRLNSGQGNKR